MKLIRKLESQVYSSRLSNTHFDWWKLCARTILTCYSFSMLMFPFAVEYREAIPTTIFRNDSEKAVLGARHEFIGIARHLYTLIRMDFNDWWVMMLYSLLQRCNGNAFVQLMETCRIFFLLKNCSHFRSTMRFHLFSLFFQFLFFPSYSVLLCCSVRCTQRYL